MSLSLVRLDDLSYLGQFLAGLIVLGSDLGDGSADDYQESRYYPDPLLVEDTYSAGLAQKPTLVQITFPG